MKRITIEFSGGNMDGKRYDTEGVHSAEREAAVAYYQKTSEGREGAVEFAKPSEKTGIWQRYKVTARREDDRKITVMLQYSQIA